MADPAPQQHSDHSVLNLGPHYHEVSPPFHNNSYHILFGSALESIKFKICVQIKYLVAAIFLFNIQRRTGIMEENFRVIKATVCSMLCDH